jgi:hypothetical protein
MAPTSTEDTRLPAQLGLSEGVVATARKVVRQYNRAFQLPEGGWPASPGEWVALANWMVANLRHSVSPGSWRVYRAAIRQVCKDNAEVAGLMQVKGVRRIKGTERRTSAKRKKGVNAVERAKVSAWLRENAPTWGRVAALWLDTTAMTGLRPSEWQTAALTEHHGAWYLRIAENGKSGSGNQALALPTEEGRTGRVVSLSHLSSYEIDQIRKQLLVAASMLGFRRWDTYYNACRNAIYNATRAVFPGQSKTVSLYSARHQFAAHLKEADVDTHLAARLMGHDRSDNTFRRHYGGRAATNPRPIPKTHQAALLKAVVELEEMDQ